MKLRKTIKSGFSAVMMLAALCTAAAAQELIAFDSTRDGNWEIYTMAPDGSDHVRLTNDPALDSSPSISPQGRKIVFTSDRTGNNDIFIMNSDGSGLTNLTDHPAGDGSPAFSPDGSKIAFSSTRGGGFPQIYVMDIDGSNIVQLTNTVEDNYYPVFSPDGGKIIFSSYRDGDLEIYSMNTDGSEQTRLTFAPGFDGDPNVGVDGRITFASNRDTPA